MTSLPTTTLRDDAVGFGLSVPPSWFELDLAPATRDSAIGALVEDRVREQPELREHRSTISRLLRRQAQDAWDSGARFCACMVEPTDDGPITASATVSIVPGPLGVSPDDTAYLDALMAPLAQKSAKDEDDTWREVAPLELPGGFMAARAWGVEDVDLPQDSGWVRVVSLLQLVPVPGTNRVVVLTCSSPVVPLAEVLVDLFSAVADTLQVVRTTALPEAYEEQT